MTIASHALNLRHLGAFLEVCRTGGITAAAPAANLSQPAITQAIARLEARLGVPLFIRTGTGMTPTDAAGILADRAARALGTLRTGLRAARSGSAAAPGVGAVTGTQLRALLALADTGNFTLAARSIGLSLPSVYRAARDLEVVAGEALYRRTPHGFDLTPAGRAVARAARLMFAELDQALAEIAAWRGAEASAIRLGALPLARSTMLAEALSRLGRARPGMRVEVIEGPYDDLLNALRDGRIDILLGALRSPSPAPDVTQEELFSDRLGIFAGPDHPLTRAPGDPGDFPWVLSRAGTPTRAFFDAYAAARGWRPPGVIETSSPVLVRSLLQDCAHLTMLSVNQMRFDAERGSVVRLPVDLDDPPRPIGMAMRRDWRPTAAQGECVELLRAAGRALATSRPRP